MQKQGGGSSCGLLPSMSGGTWSPTVPMGCTGGSCGLPVISGGGCGCGLPKAWGGRKHRKTRRNRKQTRKNRKQRKTTRRH